MPKDLVDPVVRVQAGRVARARVAEQAVQAAEGLEGVVLEGPVVPVALVVQADLVEQVAAEEAALLLLML
jgi:hypothetical protein